MKSCRKSSLSKFLALSLGLSVARTFAAWFTIRAGDDLLLG